MNKSQALELTPPPSRDEQAGMVAMMERLVLNPDLPVDKLEKLLDMQIKIRAIEAETAFAEAMARVQSSLPTVVRDAPNTQTNSKYAKHEKIAKAIKPIYTREGFSITFSEGESKKDKHVRIVGILRHSAGHKETHFIDVAIDDVGIKGSVNKTLTHAEASSGTYGRRLLTCLMFDVALGNDNDGNGSGQQDRAKITESQAADLDALIEEVKANKPAFLKFYKIEKVADLAAADLAGAVAELNRKRK